MRVSIRARVTNKTNNHVTSDRKSVNVKINENENKANECPTNRANECGERKRRIATKQEPFNLLIYYINKTIQDIKMAIINTIALANSLYAT